MPLVPSTLGAQLHLHDWGGRGPDLLAVHAAGFHGAAFGPLAAELRDAPGGPWRVVAPDLRAHGHSRLPEPHDLSWTGFADDVLAVVDALGLQHAVGVGHSMGGAALVLAEARRPGTFRALYLYEPVIFPPGVATPGAGGSDPNSLATGALRRRRRFASPDEAFANFAAKRPLADLRADALRAYVDHGLLPTGEGDWTLACAPEDEAQLYRRGHESGAFAVLGDVHAPVAVANADDGTSPGSWAPALAAALRNGQHRPLAGVQHFGPLQDPALVAADVAAFLGGLAGDGAAPGPGSRTL